MLFVCILYAHLAIFIYLALCLYLEYNIEINIFWYCIISLVVDQKIYLHDNFTQKTFFIYISISLIEIYNFVETHAYVLFSLWILNEVLPF